MATTKPRITVTLTKRQHEVLVSISQNSGQSMSAMLGEFIEAALPTFERMATTMQHLKRAQNVERSKVIGFLDEAQAALEPIVMAAAGQFDLFMNKVDDAVVISAVQGREALAAGDDGRTTARSAPGTNRGATTPRRKATNPGQPRATAVSSPKGFLKKSGV